MTNKDFNDFCYDQYKEELNLADVLYQRAGFLLTSQVILGGIIIALARSMFQTHRNDLTGACLNFLSSGFAFISLAVSVIFLMITAYPRKYERIAPMLKWKDWREKYRLLLHADDLKAEKRNQAALEEQTSKALLESLAAAQTKNAELNRQRLLYFQYGIFTTMLSVVGFFLQALLHFIIYPTGG